MEGLHILFVRRYRAFWGPARFVPLTEILEELGGPVRKRKLANILSWAIVVAKESSAGPSHKSVLLQ